MSVRSFKENCPKLFILWFVLRLHSELLQCVTDMLPTAVTFPLIWLGTNPGKNFGQCSLNELKTPCKKFRVLSQKLNSLNTLDCHALRHSVEKYSMLAHVIKLYLFLQKISVCSDDISIIMTSFIEELSQLSVKQGNVRQHKTSWHLYNAIK